MRMGLRGTLLIYVYVSELNRTRDRITVTVTTACVFFSALSLTVVRGTISVIAIVLVERREGGEGQRKVRHK